MIQIKNLTKAYEGEYVYNHFCMTLEEQAVIAILSKSGEGKTTLLRILAGLESYQQGEIIGIENKKIAYVFQEDRLIPWLTVEQNISFVLKGRIEESEIKKRIDEWLHKLHLEEVRKNYPRTLSGGMKRRVTLARAFCYPYDLLLLDEPFKGLQKELKEEIIAMLLEKQQRECKTILWSGHDEEEIQDYVQYIKRIKKDA